MGERGRDILLASAKSVKEFSRFKKSLLSDNAIKFGDFKGAGGKRLTTGVSELLQELNQKQLDILWKDLITLTVTALRSLSEGLSTVVPESSEEINADKLDEDCLCTLEGVCVITLSCLKLEEPLVSKDMVQALLLLHGSVFDLHSISPRLANCVCVICEEWWRKNLESREKLCLNAITMFLQRFIQNDKKEKFSSIYHMRSCLSLFDFKLKKPPSEETETLPAASEQEYIDGTIGELRSLLLACFSQYTALQDNDGRKFLAGVMLLNKDLAKAAHAIATGQMKPSTPDAKAEGLGIVYYHAWRMATDEKKTEFEDICIQDLMYQTVHAPRTKVNNLFRPFRLMLNAIICHKGAVEVRHMVTRLYAPILWRSLKAINPMVRANASSLLIDAFPLEEEDSNRPRLANSEDFMQKQYDALDCMLFDDCPRIRIIGIRGFCDVLHMYYDAIPASIIAILCRKLFNDLAFDVCVEVRQAVLQGAVVLLDAPCSHMLLSKLLPSCVEKCIHDVSEKVRIAAADTLLAIKKTSTISFWNVCPVANIIGQLEVEKSQSVSKRLVKLVFSSFLPETGSKQVWVERCVSFYRKRVNAARKFYMISQSDLSVQEIGEFMHVIGVFIYNCVTRTLQQENSRMMDSDVSDVNQTTDGSSENSQLWKSPIDAEILAALLETACVLWKAWDHRSSSKKMEGRKREDVKRIMLTYSRVLRACFKFANDERTLNAILLLSARLPPDSLPAFSKSVLPKLRSLSDDTPDTHYSMLIECICAWDWTKQVLELVRDWLSDATKSLGENGTTENTGRDAETEPRRISVRLQKDPTNENTAKGKRKKKTVMFTGVTSESRPAQAIRYLSCFLDIQSRKSFQVLGQPACQAILLSISHTLKKCQVEVTKRITSQSSQAEDGGPWTNDLLGAALDARFNLLTILCLNEETAGESVVENGGSLIVEEIAGCVDWFANCIDAYQESSKAKLNTSVLTVQPTMVPSVFSMYRIAFNTCLSSCLDFLSCGMKVVDRVEDALVKFCISGINLIEYVGLIARMMLRLHECKVLQIAPDIKLVDSESVTEEVSEAWSQKNEKLIQIFDSLLSTSLQHARQNPDSFLQVFRNDVRPHLRSLVKQQHLFYSLCPKRGWYEILARKSILAVLADLFTEVRSGFSCRDRIADLSAFTSSMLPILVTTLPEFRYVCEVCILDIAKDGSTFEPEREELMLQAFAHLLYTLSKDGKDPLAADRCVEEMALVPGFKQVMCKVKAGEGLSTNVSVGKESTRREEESLEEEQEQEEILILEEPEQQGMLFNGISDEDLVY